MSNRYRNKKWKWAFGSLKKSKEKCRIPIVDCVFIEPGKGIVHWLWCNKDGCIARKKPASYKFEPLLERFKFLAQEVRQNKICVIRFHNGSSKTATEEQFKEVFKDLDSNFVAGFQAFFQSKGAGIRSYRNSYAVDIEQVGDRAVAKTVVVGDNGEEAGNLTDQHLAQTFNKYTARVVKHIESARKCSVSHLEVDYAVDRQGRIWLSNFNKVIVVEPNQPNQSDASRDGLVLPQIGSRSDSRNRSRPVSQQSESRKLHGNSRSRSKTAPATSFLLFGENEPPELPPDGPRTAYDASPRPPTHKSPSTKVGGGKGSKPKGKGRGKGKGKGLRVSTGFSGANSRVKPKSTRARKGKTKGARKGKGVEDEMKAAMDKWGDKLLQFQEHKQQHHHAAFGPSSPMRKTPQQRRGSGGGGSGGGGKGPSGSKSLAAAQATAAAYERENNLLSTQVVEGIQQLTDAHGQASLLRDENARLKEELANVRDATDAATVALEDHKRKLKDEKRRCADKLRRANETTRQSMLALEAKFHRQMAESDASSSARSGVEPMRELISNVEELQARLESKTRQWEQERGTLWEDRRQAELGLKREQEAALSVLRQRVVSHEDANSKLATTNAKLNAENELLRSKEEDIKTRLMAITRERDTQVRSIRELKEELDEFKTAGAKKEEDLNNDQLEAFQAESQAKLRQLTNELAYVRAELASSEEYKDELSQSLQVVTVQCERAKGECKKLAKEFEAARRQELQALNAKFQDERDAMEDKRKEAEDQLAALKIRLTEVMNEVTATQKREKKAKAEAQENAEERDKLEDKFIELKRQLAERPRGDASANGSSSLTISAQNRRIAQLENQLALVQNNFESEKEQYQDMQQMLASQRKRHNEAIGDLKALLKSERRKREDIEEDLIALREKSRDDTGALDHTVKHLTAQLAAAQTQSNDVREQHRANIRKMQERETAHLETVAELERQKRERQDERARAEKASATQRKALESIKGVVSDLEDRKAMETGSLRRQLAASHVELSSVQQQSLQMQKQADHERKVSQRQASTRLMAVVLQGWLRSRVRASFRAWKAAVDVGVLHSQLLGERRKALADQKDAVMEDISLLQQTLKQAHEQQLKDLASQYSDEGKAQTERSMAEMEARLQERHHREISQVQSDCNTTLAAKTNQQRERLQMLAADRLSRAHEQAMKLAQAHDAKVAEMTLAHETATTELKKEFNKQLVSLKSQAEVAQAVAATARMDKDNASNLHEKQMDLAMDSLRSELTARNEGLKAKAIMEVEQALKTEHAAAMTEAHESAEAKLQAAVASVRSEAEAQRNEALLQQAKDMEETHKAKSEAAVQKVTSELHEALRKQSEAAEMTRKKQVDTLTAERDKISSDTTEKIDRLTKQVKDLRASSKALRLQLEDNTNMLNIEHAKAMNKLSAEHLQHLKQLNEDNKAAQAKIATELIASHDVALSQKEDQHEAALEALRVEAKAELAAKMNQAREETAKMCKLLEKDKATALAKATETAAAELAAAKAGWESEMNATMAQKLEQAEVAKRNAVRDMEEDAEADMQERVLELEQEMEAEKEKAMQELQAQQEQAQQKILEEKEQALAQLEERMERQQRDAMDELRAESEQLIREFEDVVAGVREEKNDLEVELEDARNAIEEVEDSNYDLHQQLNTVKQAGAALRLRLIIAMVQCVGAVKRTQDAADKRLNSVVHRMDEQQQQAVDRLTGELDSAQGRAAQLDEVKLKMQDTLINHKRDVLVQHKVQSAAIQSDLEVLANRKETISRRVKNLMDDMGMLKGSLTTIENEIHELSKQSALSNDGEVNVEMLQKKRRLDKDYNELLEKISAKQKQLRMAKEQLADVEEQEKEKAEDLKELESKLVSVLMEQQKRMLSVVGSVASASSSLKAVGKFNKKRLKDV